MDPTSPLSTAPRKILNGLVRWSLRVVAIVVAAIGTTIAAFMFGILFLGSDGVFATAFLAVIPLAGGVPAAIVVGIPGLVLLDRARLSKPWAGIALSILVGIAAGAIFGRQMSETGREWRESLSLFLPAGLALGLVGGSLFSFLDPWLADGVRHIREEQARNRALRAMTPEDRRLLGSRMDRDR